MDTIVRYEGEEVNLCVSRVDDEAIEVYAKWLNDPTASDYVGRSNSVISANDEKDYILSMGTNSKMHFSICLKDGTPIGLCELIPDYKNGHANIVVLIGELVFRSHGYGSEAIKLLSNFAFNECRMRMLYARVPQTNEAAMRAFSKAGFVLCGTQHNYTFANGKYSDMNTYEFCNTKPHWVAE